LREDLGEVVKRRERRPPLETDKIPETEKIFGTGKVFERDKIFETSKIPAGERFRVAAARQLFPTPDAGVDPLFGSMESGVLGGIDVIIPHRYPAARFKK
jgi:hypothetical protein